MIDKDNNKKKEFKFFSEFNLFISKMIKITKFDNQKESTLDYL